MSDFGIEVNNDNMTKVVDVIRRAKTDVIITHYFDDYSNDHNNTFALVLDASLAATVPNVPSKYPPIKKIPAIYMMEPLAGYKFQPEVYVDITETFEVKNKMLNCHQSQIRWAQEHGGVDFEEYIEVVAKFRGYQASVKMAEGFIAHKSYGHISAIPLLP